MAEPTKTNEDVFKTVLENNEDINGNGSSHIVTSNNNWKTMAEDTSGVVSRQATGNTITGKEAPANDIQQVEDPSKNKATPGAENGIDPLSQKVMDAAEINAQAGYGSQEASAARAAEFEAKEKQDEGTEVKNADEKQPVKEQPVKEEPQEQPQEDAQPTPGSDFKGQTYSEYMDENTKSNLSYMSHTLADIGIATLDAASHALEAQEKQYGALVDLATAGLTGKPMTIASQALTSTVSGLGAAKKAMDDIGVQSLGLKPGMDPEKMRDKLAIKGAAYYRDRDRANMAQKFIAKTYADAINQYAQGKNVTELSDEDIANIEGAIDKVMGKDWGRVQTKDKSEWTLEDRAFNAAYESMEKGLRKQSRTNRKKAMEAEAEFNKPENLLKEYAAGTLTDPKHQRRLLRSLRDLERAGTLDNLPNGRATLNKLNAVYNTRLASPDDILRRYNSNEETTSDERSRLKRELMRRNVAGKLNNPDERRILTKLAWQDWVRGLQMDMLYNHTSLAKKWIDNSKNDFVASVNMNEMYNYMADPQKLAELLKDGDVRRKAVGFARMTAAVDANDVLRTTYPLDPKDVQLGRAIFEALWGMPAPDIPQDPPKPKPASKAAPAGKVTGQPIGAGTTTKQKSNIDASKYADASKGGKALTKEEVAALADAFDETGAFNVPLSLQEKRKLASRYAAEYIGKDKEINDRQRAIAKLNHLAAAARIYGVFEKRKDGTRIDWHDLKKYADMLKDETQPIPDLGIDDYQDGRWHSTFARNGLKKVLAYENAQKKAQQDKILEEKKAQEAAERLKPENIKKDWKIAKEAQSPMLRQLFLDGPEKAEEYLDAIRNEAIKSGNRLQYDNLPIELNNYENSLEDLLKRAESVGETEMASAINGHLGTVRTLKKMIKPIDDEKVEGESIVDDGQTLDESVDEQSEKKIETPKKAYGNWKVDKDKKSTPKNVQSRDGLSDKQKELVEKFKKFTFKQTNEDRKETEFINAMRKEGYTRADAKEIYERCMKGEFGNAIPVGGPEGLRRDDEKKAREADNSKVLEAYHKKIDDEGWDDYELSKKDKNGRVTKTTLRKIFDKSKDLDDFTRKIDQYSEKGNVGAMDAKSLETYYAYRSSQKDSEPPIEAENTPPVTENVPPETKNVPPVTEKPPVKEKKTSKTKTKTPPKRIDEIKGEGYTAWKDMNGNSWFQIDSEKSVRPGTYEEYMAKKAPETKESKVGVKKKVKLTSKQREQLSKSINSNLSMWMSDIEQDGKSYTARPTKDVLMETLEYAQKEPSKFADDVKDLIKKFNSEDFQKALAFFKGIKSKDQLVEKTVKEANEDKEKGKRNNIDGAVDSSLTNAKNVFEMQQKIAVYKTVYETLGGDEAFKIYGTQTVTKPETHKDRNGKKRGTTYKERKDAGLQ